MRPSVIHNQRALRDLPIAATSGLVSGPARFKHPRARPISCSIRPSNVYRETATTSLAPQVGGTRFGKLKSPLSLQPPNNKEFLGRVIDTQLPRRNLQRSGVRSADVSGSFPLNRRAGGHRPAASQTMLTRGRAGRSSSFHRRPSVGTVRRAPRPRKKARPDDVERTIVLQLGERARRAGPLVLEAARDPVGPATPCSGLALTSRTRTQGQWMSQRRSTASHVAALIFLRRDHRFRAQASAALDHAQRQPSG